MANIFDKDTGNTDNHLLNEQFHAFSKSPSSPGSTLGGASNRSGHTVSASDVWAEKIPAFFYPKADSDYEVCKANAKLNDICRWGDEIQIWDGEKFVKFADNYAAIPDGHEFLNEDGQPVVRFHKSRVAYNLNDTNNAYDNSLDATGKGAAAKILGWDKTANDGAGAVYAYVESAPQFITQFVAPTDNIVKGVPSKGYGPIVMVGGSPLTEDADSTAGYIANNFAGIIQFNERKTQGTVTVHAFEYCGKTLGTTVSDIAELEDIISKISVTANGGIQGVSEDATTTGLSTKWVKNVEGEEVDAQPNEEGAYPVLTISTGSVADNETKLVTGGAVKTYVDTTALAEGGSIAEYIENYVATNAKVSVNGQSATTITVAGTEASSNDLVKVVVTEDKTVTDKIGLKLTATIDEAVFDKDGNLEQDGVVIATIAEKIAENTIKDAITTDNGAIKDAIDNAITGATLNSGTQGDNQIQTSTGDAANKLVTAAQVKEYVTENAQVTVTVGETEVTSTGFEFEGSTGTDVSVGAVMDENGKVTYSATLSKATVTDGVIDTATTGNGDKVISATDAKAVAEKAASAAINAAVADGAVIDSRIDEVIGISLNATTTEGTIGKAISDVAATANSAVQSVSRADGSSTLLTVNDGTNVTISLSTEVATKTDAATAASTAITNSLASTADNTIGKAIADAKKAGTDAATAADGKVADVTVDGTSIVSGEAGSKKAALTTTKVAAITPSVDSSSTALATEASVAKALASITSVGVSYEVIPDGQKHTDITTPVNGRIYLEKDSTNADAGVYIEWMYTEKGWEQIGSTKTDHSSYASTITVNGSPKNVTDSAVDLGTFVSSVADGTVTGTVSTTGELELTVDTEALVENGSIKASVTDANALVKAGDALEAIKLAKPDNYVASVTGYTATGTEVTTTQGAEIKVLDGRGTSVTANDLWGTTATMDASGVITVDHKYLSNPNGDEAWLENVKAVQDNKAYSEITTDSEGDFTGVTESSVIANIQTGMIKFGNDMFYETSLASFSGDLNSLVDGTRMFKDTALTSFSSDLSNLVDGEAMFAICTNLASFTSDLSNLVHGNEMFSGCEKLTSFTSDLSNLVDGESMFGMTSLNSFNSDLSSLVNAKYMFFRTPLTSFTSDLSSLVDGNDMFRECPELTSFNGDLSSLVDGNSMFGGCTKLTSFNGDLSSLVDGSYMFKDTAITSFNGDLSSLVNGFDMFREARLDTETVECIADTINDVSELSYNSSITGSDGKTYNVTRQIGIFIANETPNEAENAAFWTMNHEKGWYVYVNGSQYNPTEPTAIATLDENGEEVATPIPFWAKPVETDEEHAEYVGEDGKFYQVVGGQFIYVSDPETYGQFTSLADAVANMRLTKYEKPVEEEN